MMTRGGKISEKDFSTYVEGLLNQYGWRWTHFRPAMERSGKWLTALSGHKGMLDYIAVKGQRLIFAELKGDKGRLTKEQQEWIDALFEVSSYKGIEVYVWKPIDWEIIYTTLQG